MTVALSLFACAGGESGGDVALDPRDGCAQPSAALGTGALDDCVTTLIEERCMEAGLEPQTSAYDQCTQAYRRAVFLAHQIELSDEPFTAPD